VTEEKKGWFQRFKKKPEQKSEQAAEQTVEAAPESVPIQTLDVASEVSAEPAPAPISESEQPDAAAPTPNADVTAPKSIAPKEEASTNGPTAPVTTDKPVAETSENDAPATAEITATVEKVEAAEATQTPETAAGAAEERAGWFQRLKTSLKKSTGAISGGITGIFTKAKLDDETLEELEDLLITSDLGVAVAAKLTGVLSKDRFNKEITGEEVKEILAAEIEAILAPVAVPLVVDGSNKPHIILMAGVNGAGKTTTIGKLAKKFKEDGKSVMLAAGDTFRAAAVEQLTIWGERTGVPVITKEIGSESAALAYEAVDRAVKDDVDVLLIDTAGRLQNREELMDELAKVVRVIGKKLPGAPHDTIIVLDATTGQNAVHQVEVFQKMAAITGIVMTKLDGSARGGVLVACAEKFGLPVHAIGIGESIEDLQPFDAKEFANALVGLET